MRVLTVKQPWASLIASGEKRIENRTYLPPRAIAGGERFAIHAGRGWDAAGAKRVDCQLRRDDLPSGMIVCTARIDKIVTEMDDLYFVGPFGWVLTDIEETTSVELQGQLGLWSIEDSVIRSRTRPR